MSHQPTHCPCGSGEFAQPLFDARNIFAGYACVACREQVKAQYRPEIFTDSNYYCDEPIEED